MVLSNLENARLMQKDPWPGNEGNSRCWRKCTHGWEGRAGRKIKWLLVPKTRKMPGMWSWKSGLVQVVTKASIFAGDLYQCTPDIFDTKGWKTEVIDANEGSVGGYNKVVLEVHGEDIFGKLKFESGAHRVQRVPETEARAAFTHRQLR